MTRKPGPGWRYLGSGTWECGSVRVHMYGLTITPDTAIHWADTWPESEDARRFIRIAGGNRKRGLMLWAMWLHENAAEALTCQTPN